MSEFFKSKIDDIPVEDVDFDSLVCGLMDAKDEATLKDWLTQ